MNIGLWEVINEAKVLKECIEKDKDRKEIDHEWVKNKDEWKMGLARCLFKETINKRDEEGDSGRKG